MLTVALVIVCVGLFATVIEQYIFYKKFHYKKDLNESFVVWLNETKNYSPGFYLQEQGLDVESKEVDSMQAEETESKA